MLWTNEDIGYATVMAVDSAANIFLPNGSRLEKYGPDGVLLWQVTASDAGGIADIAMTPEDDVVAIGAQGDGLNRDTWAAKFRSVDGSRLRPLLFPAAGEKQVEKVAVDSQGNVILAADGPSDYWLRKYDSALFRR